MREPASARRQRRAGGVRREIVHKVLVGEAEEAVLRAKAAERAITVSRLMVESALAGDARTAEQWAEVTDELFHIVHLLGRVSNNINQLAKVANATQVMQPETAAALAAVRRTCARLEPFAKGFGGL